MAASEIDEGERAAGTVGERLREARQDAGLDLNDIAGRTRIPIRHLQSIEEGRHETLPAVAYSTGFVKTYARVVGLDEAQLSRRWREEAGLIERDRVAAEPYAPADPSRTPSRALALVSLLVAILIGVGYLYWRGSQDGAVDRERLAAAPDVTAPPPAARAPAARPAAPAAAPAATPAATGQVTIEAVDPVWLKVYEYHGATLFMGLMEAGKRYDVPATAVDPRLLTGRPGAIRVMVGATAIPPLGDPKKTIKDVPLKPAALLARAAPATAPALPATAPADNAAAAR